IGVGALARRSAEPEGGRYEVNNRAGRIAIIVALAVMPLRADNWPAWRGPTRNGVSGETNLPLKWSQTENVAWKLPMPPFSGSPPIVWGKRIFLNVADDLHSTDLVTLHLWCVDRQKGTRIWERPLGGGNHREQKQNMSSPSPVTDGSHVWVLTGTGILKAFD